MTEDEAKTKACPFGKVRSTYDANWNKGECIGSACMAWRWEGYRAEDGKWVRKVADGEKWDPAKAEGYCGLAGRE